jgi:medium-chain acyl-[acyl-carrier-protein] hydrolase
MGALICFELARALVKRGGPGPVHLLLSAFPAPQLLARAATPALHTLPDAELLAALRRSQATPEVLLQNQELMELTLPTLRADQALVGTYRYRAEQKLSCPFTIFGGQEDAAISASDLAAWSEQTTGPCHVRLFLGGHFYFITAEEALVHTIAEELQPSLVSAPQRSERVQDPVRGEPCSRSSS